MEVVKNGEKAAETFAPPKLVYHDFVFIEIVLWKSLSEQNGFIEIAIVQTIAHINVL